MGKKTAGPSQSPQWPELPKAPTVDPSSTVTTALLSHPIDESPEFHDPYSDLNLFLAGKVKEEYKSSPTAKKWSLYVQEKLVEKIVPEFQKRFPHYRLGVAALKKIWEKFAYFSSAFENQKEALTSEGKLNVKFLIRENLKQFLGAKKSFSFHPYLLAQQLALKISECLAAYDGVRPMLQHITKTIWAVKRHLIPPSQMPADANPYYDFDSWDKLIIKFMLEAAGKNPNLSQEELQQSVRDTLYALKDLPPEDELYEVAYTLAERLSSGEPLIGHRLETEILNIMIDNPSLDLDTAAEQAVHFFIRAQELAAGANWIEIEHKLTFWTIQGDLVYRCLRIENHQLLMHIRHHKSVQAYIEKYPFLEKFRSQAAIRAEILSKFEWYAAAPDTQSTVERFFEWHRQLMPEELEELCKRQLPLLPFDRKLISSKI
jgi:hypothetical protein